MNKRCMSLLMVILITIFSFAGCSALGIAEDQGAGAGSAATTEGGKTDSADTAEGGEIQEIDPDVDPYLVEKESNGIFYEEAGEGAPLSFVEADPSRFYGKWTATSDQALYMYGNVDLVVNSNGTWTANITDEKLGGPWKMVDDHMHMEDDMFSFDLSFEESGKLIMREDLGDGGELRTVLTKAD